MNTLDKIGTFAAKVTGAEISESATGKPFLALSFSTAEGDIGRRLYLSDAAWDYSMKTLTEVFSFDGDFANIDQLVGKACNIVTEDEEGSNGNKYIVVKWINGEKAAKPAQAAGASLIERLTQKAKAQSARADSTDEDIF